MLTGMTDEALLTHPHSDEAFRVIYLRYWEGLYKKAFHHLKNEHDAEDAVQEIFISLWRNKQTIDASNQLSAYLFTALKYHIIKTVYRKAKKGIIVPLSIKDLLNPHPDTEEALQYKETQSRIAAEVRALPQRMQQVYQMSRVEDLPTSKIARSLKLSEQTVKNTLTTALKRLRQKLAQTQLFF